MPRNKLFVGGLAWATTETSLRSVCEPYGEIEEVKVVVDQNTGRSKGFGFVTFTDEASATRFKEEMDGKTLDGRTIRVDFSKERKSSPRRSFDRGFGRRRGY